MIGSKVCTIGGCEKPRSARGFCKSHYMRFRRYGNPLAGRPAAPPEPPTVFFHEQLSLAIAHPSDDCLLWPYSRGKDNGYGQLREGGRTQLVHRLACIKAHGPPPTRGMNAAHSCRNRHCFQPAHVRWATSKENAADKNRDGTSIYGTKHYSARLTEFNVQKIRQHYAAGGAFLRELATEYGVSKKTIWDIVHRVTWKHLDSLVERRMDQ